MTMILHLVNNRHRTMDISPRHPDYLPTSGCVLCIGCKPYSFPQGRLLRVAGAPRLGTRVRAVAGNIPGDLHSARRVGIWTTGRRGRACRCTSYARRSINIGIRATAPSSTHYPAHSAARLIH